MAPPTLKPALKPFPYLPPPPKTSTNPIVKPSIHPTLQAALNAPTPPSTRRGKEVGIGRRGAAIALSKTGLPLRDIAKLIDVPPSTICGIIQHAEQMAKLNGGDTLDDINLKPKKRSGRPKKWSVEDRLVVVELCTRDDKQRCKPFSVLAKECPFNIDEHAIRKILSEAGFDRQRDVPDATLSSAAEDE